MKKAVLVEWKDIVYDAGWHTQNKLDEFVTNENHDVVHQLGFVIEEDENQLVLVDSYFKDASAYGTIHKIPKGCIVSVTEITL